MIDATNVYVPILKEDGLKKTLEYLYANGLMSGLPVTFFDVGGLEGKWEGDRKGIDKYEMLKSFHVEPKDFCRPLSLLGSNSNHHLTYAMCRKLIDPRGKDYTVVHFDKHEDGAIRDPYSVEQTRDEEIRDIINCGRFYDKLLADSPHAKAVAMIDEEGNLTLNADGRIWIVARDIWSYRLLKEAREYHDYDFSDRIVDIKYAKSDRRFLKKVCDMIPTRHIYLTTDLDVLSHEYACTDWGHGKMELQVLLDGLRTIMKGKEPLGADMCGISSELFRNSANFPRVRGIPGKISRSLYAYGEVFAALAGGVSSQS